MENPSNVVAKETEFQKLHFTGTASDYFGIWIVNIFLTILTFGIYSAWAKVRRRRYFQGHTLLEGHGFGYHATGKQIFLGRLLAFGLFALFVIPVIQVFAGLILFFIFPLLIHRSLRFNARVTSYRNIRFSFIGTTKEAYKAFLLGPFLATISLGILAPIANQWRQHYVGNNMMYGDRPFKTNIPIKSLYKIWLSAVGLTFIFVIINTLVIGIIAINDQNEGQSVYNLGLALFDFFLLITYFGIFIVWFVYALRIKNLAWSSTILDYKHPIRSNLPWKRYLWITISNGVISLITLGLMRPWAAIRFEKFRWEHTSIQFNGDLGEIISDVEKTTTPIAAEYLDIDGFDFGF